MRGCEGRNLGSVALEHLCPTMNLALRSPFPFLAGGWMLIPPVPVVLHLRRAINHCHAASPNWRAGSAALSPPPRARPGRTNTGVPSCSQTRAPGAMGDFILARMRYGVVLLGHLRPAIVCSLGRRLTGSGLPLVLHNSDPRLLNRRLGWAGQYETPTVN